MRGQQRRRRQPHRDVTRRGFIKGLLCSILAAGGLSATLSSCTPARTEAEGRPDSVMSEGASTPSNDRSQSGDEAHSLAPVGPISYVWPDERAEHSLPGGHSADPVRGTASLRIDKIGTFEFGTSQIVPVRTDVFQPSRFSLFDVLLHLAELGEIALEQHYDDDLGTHVIDAIDGRSGWWYQVHYANGWFEQNVFRMDLYPYKNGTTLRILRRDQSEVDAILDTFRQEVARKRASDDVIIPKLSIQSYRNNWEFRDVQVKPHNLRPDLFHMGTVTAIDVLLTLAEEGRLEPLKLTWYERIAAADPVDSYFVEGVGDDVASGGCGFVYESGPEAFAGFRGTHIHLPSDARVIVSPEYLRWFWIFLGGGM